MAAAVASSSSPAMTDETERHLQDLLARARMDRAGANVKPIRPTAVVGTPDSFKNFLAEEDEARGFPIDAFRPRGSIFEPVTDEDPGPPPVRTKEPPLVNRMTTFLRETHLVVTPDTPLGEALTSPSEPVGNDGYDNAEHDLILHVDDVIRNSVDGTNYVITSPLGAGSFGQVVRCWKSDTCEYVALKVIKNSHAYTCQAKVEIEVLHKLNHEHDPDDQHHIVRLLDTFPFRSHLCLTFELLKFNLYEMLRQNQFRGMSIGTLRALVRQLLEAMVVLRKAHIIHCDLKPENIMLQNLHGEIKVIDFGSACSTFHTVYSYIQSRFYRSPEVVLGVHYGPAIDMWSVGCVAFELFLGKPLFPVAGDYDLMQRAVQTLGSQLPDSVLKEANHTANFFKRAGDAVPSTSLPTVTEEGTAESEYTLLNMAEVEERSGVRPPIAPRSTSATRLEDMIAEAPIRVNTGFPDGDGRREAVEGEIRRSIEHLLRGFWTWTLKRDGLRYRLSSTPFSPSIPKSG